MTNILYRNQHCLFFELYIKNMKFFPKKQYINTPLKKNMLCTLLKKSLTKISPLLNQSPQKYSPFFMNQKDMHVSFESKKRGKYLKIKTKTWLLAPVIKEISWIEILFKWKIFVRRYSTNIRNFVCWRYFFRCYSSFLSESSQTHVCWHVTQLKKECHIVLLKAKCLWLWRLE